MPNQVGKKVVTLEALSGFSTRRLSKLTNAKIEKVKASLLNDKGIRKNADTILQEALELYASKQSIEL
jgi:hypothetical protein